MRERASEGVRERKRETARAREQEAGFADVTKYAKVPSDIPPACVAKALSVEGECQRERAECQIGV
jgi:hypothetical protein